MAEVTRLKGRSKEEKLNKNKKKRNEKNINNSKKAIKDDKISIPA